MLPHSLDISVRIGQEADSWDEVSIILATICSQGSVDHRPRREQSEVYSTSGLRDVLQVAKEG